VTSASRGLTDVEGVVVGTLATMSAVPDAVTPDALLADLDIDSLDLVELAQLLADEHGVAVPATEFGEVETVGDVVDRVTKAVR
jgi:acyl carrier protein